MASDPTASTTSAAPSLRGRGEQRVRQLFGTHRRVGDGLGPGAAFVIRLADENPHGAEEARDDAGQRPYRPGTQYDHGSGKRKRAEPKRMDARCNRLGQHRNVGRQLVVDDVSATRRNRARTRRTHRAVFPRRARGADRCSRGRNGSSSTARREPGGSPRRGYRPALRHSGDADITSPMSSCPMMSGGVRRGLLVATPWTSLPQIPARSTLTSTSPSPTRRHLDVHDVECPSGGVHQGTHQATAPPCPATHTTRSPSARRPAPPGRDAPSPGTRRRRGTARGARARR